MNILLAASSSGLIQLLWVLLIAVVIIAVLGGVIWAINKYIAPIPPPILTIIAIIVLIIFIIWFLGHIPNKSLP